MPNSLRQALRYFSSNRSMDDAQALRVKVALEVGSVALIAAGLLWVFLLTTSNAWQIAWIEGLLVLLGTITLVLTRKGRMRIAAFLLLSILFLILLAMSFFLDVPTASAPRVVHHYFLLLAFYAYLLLKNECEWLRMVFFFICLAAFVVFSSTYWGVATPYALAEEVRVIGGWMNAIIATGLLCITLYILQSDFVESGEAGHALSLALWHHQFELYYQPQVDETGKVFAAEALIRWHHPKRGFVLPVDFIPLAEQLGMMVPIGHWVLAQACKQLASWALKPETAHLTLSVNVSAPQFSESEFVPKLLALIECTGIDAKRLKLELTESMLVKDAEDVIAKMALLKKVGVGVALDDFGTGYSSLSYLKRLPLDQLKIDQSFIRDILTDLHDAAIARTIIALGQELGLKVIAEGVEAEAQRSFLLENGCYAFQGYWFSHPLPIAQFDAFVASAS
ncbi:MAG: EAL domain-containing protein [Methylotenera sp.]|nr:EAL domain-containing protein [Methylotenera sp.]